MKAEVEGTGVADQGFIYAPQGVVQALQVAQRVTKAARSRASIFSVSFASNFFVLCTLNLSASSSVFQSCYLLCRSLGIFLPCGRRFQSHRTDVHAVLFTSVSETWSMTGNHSCWSVVFLMVSVSTLPIATQIYLV